MNYPICLTCLLIAAALGQSAAAQPADCAAQPNGPPIRLQPWVGLAGQSGVPKNTQGGALLDLGAIPADGTTCENAAAPVDDVLHGAPAADGLLQGDGPRDVLHDRARGHVTVQRLTH